MMTTRQEQINIEIADAVGWDDRKQLAEIFQQHVRIDGLTDELYSGLIAVAQWGAARAADNLLDEYEPSEGLTNDQAPPQ